MPKFSLTLKDDFTNVTIEGENTNEILNHLKELHDLKKKSDEVLGFDVKIPLSDLKNIKQLEYSERIMFILYYAERAMSKSEIHQRNILLKIREGWWNGSNFTRDMTQKMKDGLIERDKKNSSKFMITQKGIHHIKNITSKDVNRDG